MPELPEVETTCRGLASKLLGAKILRAEQNRADLRLPMPKNLPAKLQGRRIISVRRRAKYILIDLDDEQSLLIHLGMSGRMVVSKPDDPAQKHDHVVLHCEDNRTVRFNDPRRFGMLDLCQTEKLPAHKLLKDLGVEPLEEPQDNCHSRASGNPVSLNNKSNKRDSRLRGNDKELNPSQHLTATYLTEKFRTKKAPIKAALLDQTIIAGLGNIYVCEALFHACISPERLASSLTTAEITALIPAIHKVLKAAIKAGGSSLRDYVQSDGALGYFQTQFAVYDHEGQSCPDCTCGKQAIARIVQSGRSTFFCPVRQR